MTFQQYIENPLGKKNAVFSQREMYKAMYTEKFDAVTLREAGRLHYELFYDKPGDTYYAYIKIPSEVVPKFYYDVVIKFTTKDNGLRVANTLKDYDVAFFSNDPAFVFTYEWVFHKNGMFVDELKPRASKLALKKNPKEKNPYEVPGYVKSIYFAYLSMKRSNLFSKALYTEVGKPFNLKYLLSQVDDSDHKIAQRQELGEQVAKKKAKEKRAGENQAISHAKAQQALMNQQRGTGKPVKVTDTAKSVKRTPSVRMVKKTTAKFDKH